MRIRPTRSLHTSKFTITKYSSIFSYRDTWTQNLTNTSLNSGYHTVEPAHSFCKPPRSPDSFFTSAPTHLPGTRMQTYSRLTFDRRAFLGTDTRACAILSTLSRATVRAGAREGVLAAGAGRLKYSTGIEGACNGSPRMWMHVGLGCEVHGAPHGTSSISRRDPRAMALHRRAPDVSFLRPSFRTPKTGK